ncbi:VOC family protein [Hymenobacter busanensis]|nr:VOC family protein [Hymenobacter busanensis]QHJ06199.1 hypothetical protein GUY19_02355 [Hymenobacter busanensis]
MHLLQVELLTDDLPATRAFYHRTLGLPATHDTEARVTFGVGTSQLTFRATRTPSKPFYHFAFLIPRNQFVEAFAWVEARTSVLPYQGTERVADFPNWNARAFYFHDPNGNIVECIARYDVPSDATAPFSGHSLLSISELGLPVAQVPAACTELQAALGIPDFWRGPKRPDFAVLGDDHGLLIVPAEGRGWLPTQRPAERHWLRLQLVHAGQVAAWEGR